MAHPLRLIVKIGRRFILGDDHRIDAAVIVEVAGGQMAADVRTRHGAPRQA